MNPSYNKKKAKTDGSIITGKGPKARALDLKFDPTNDSVIIAACVKEVSFITIDEGSRTLKVVKATGWNKNPPQAITSIAFID
mmetsp:Transcript_16129/g.13682  ORF Transcript_16129/g.13682 Transcript_16129/m.13682 type:complete len:83 (+) Transcript_16129:1278-1526(+)